MNEIYEAPAVEIVKVMVEAGFEVSRLTRTTPTSVADWKIRLHETPAQDEESD